MATKMNSGADNDRTGGRLNWAIYGLTGLRYDGSRGLMIPTSKLEDLSSERQADALVSWSISELIEMEYTGL